MPSILAGMPLSDMGGLGIAGSGGGGGGLAMNDTVPPLDIFELLDLYDDIIMANQNNR